MLPPGRRVKTIWFLGRTCYGQLLRYDDDDDGVRLTTLTTIVSDNARISKVFTKEQQANRFRRFQIPTV